jgi:NADH-quinone oxidoreductase subunit L
MFIALGTFSYSVAIFHLTTHAFFKALLFLGSGSVIHAMSEEQDITKMGGLRKKMKTTFITFFIGSLAISGIPPLSGFFSKDEILFRVFSNSGIPVYLIILVTAGITAFYMFRLVALTFYGTPRYDETKIHPHESPWTMRISLIKLAVLSAIGGFIGLPAFLGLPNLIEKWFEPVFDKTDVITSSYLATSAEHLVQPEVLLLILSVVVAITAIYFAFKKYSKQVVFEPSRGFGKILEHKYYLDEIYDKIVVNPIKNISDKFLWNIFDNKVIDKFINGIANYITRLSFDWRKLQTGIIQDYATIAITGIVIIILYLLLI